MTSEQEIRQRVAAIRRRDETRDEALKHAKHVAATTMNGVTFATAREEVEWLEMPIHDDIRFLLTEVERLQAALDAVTRERDAAVAALEPFARMYARAQKTRERDGGGGDTMDFVVNDCNSLDEAEAGFIRAYETYVAARKAARQHDDAAERSPETGGG